ncbi:MAG: extracellular matrix/biofilm biosynthesis regulator RemA family protein [Dehalobacterium sp.]
MFFHIGKDIMVSSKDIIMILDYSKIKKSAQSKNFLNHIFKNEIRNKDIKTIIITKNKTFFTSIAPNTIEKRMENINY